MKDGINYKKIKRIRVILFCPVTENSFECTAFPYSVGDCFGGIVRRNIRIIYSLRTLYAKALREDNFFMCTKPKIKLEFELKRDVLIRERKVEI